MKRITIIVLLGVLCLTASAQKSRQKDLLPLEKGYATINRTMAEAHIAFLASDELQGRESGTHDGRVAARYLATQLKLIGIEPLFEDYYQCFDAYRRERQQRGRFDVHPDSIALFCQDVHQKLRMQNVIGMIPGELVDEYVIVGAHYDHLGMDVTLEGDRIYNGADDNASGVSAVLQLARAFRESGKKPLRNVIFAFWDGEERGLLGSKYFVQQCSYINQIKGYLNYDMIGRDNKPDRPRHVVYFYTASHPEYGQWLKDDIRQRGLQLEPNYRSWDNPVGGSDNSYFARHQIPIIWYHTDGHPDYHKPSDHPHLLNYPKLVDITRASFLALWRMANE